MKTRSKAALLLLVLLVGVALAAPLLLRLNRVQSAIVGRLQQQLPFHVQLKNMRWHWWPLPGFAIKGVRIATVRWQLAAPSAEFYPAWTVFFGRAGTIVLDHPAVRLAGAADKAKEQHRGIRLPHLSLAVQDGSLFIPAGVIPSPVKAVPLQLTGIDGRFDLAPGELSVRASATSSFFHAIMVQGDFRPATTVYSFQVESEGLELHKVISSLAGGRIQPGRSAVDLKGNITGAGLAKLRADLTGEFPSFLVRSAKKPLLFTGGPVDLSLSKSGTTIALTINNFALKDPRLRLHGMILRRQSDQTAAPQWKIDLTGRNIDAAAVRKKVLAVLGHEHNVRKVAEVVRGGTATVLRIRFTGPAASLRHLKAYTVEGRFKNGAIHLPKQDLDPSDVSGNLSIQNGVLTARNLTGRLGASTGRHGKLVLALTGKRKKFLLDLDLDAQAAEIPGVLHHTVHHHDAFLREVDQFSDLKGHVTGHLHLGDHLHHPVAEITVNAVKGSGRYARIPWPFQLEGGQLKVISNRQVTWQHVKATIGPHRVAETSGSVSWGKGGIQVEVDSIRALLAAGPLFHELNRYPVVHRKLSRALTALTGTIEVTRGTFHGPFRHPRQWQYQLGLQGQDLAWTSPRLGSSVSTRKASGSLSQQEAIVTASKNNFLGQRISLTGRFRHRELAHWHGWMKLDGIAGRRLASWVKKKRWVPPAFFPRIPCIVDGLVIRWGKGHLAVSGGIVAGTGAQSPLPRVDFALRKTAHDLDIKRVAITTAHEYGLLSLDLPKGELAGFTLSWRGEVSGKAVDALLASNPVLIGRMAGVGTLHYVPGQPQRTRLVGTLRVDDVKLPLSGPEPLLIKRLNLNSDGGLLDLARLEMDFGKKQAQIRGQITTTAGGLDLDLDLTSPALSWATLVRLKKSFAGRKFGRRGNPWDLTGRLRFDVGQFTYSKDKEPKGAYRWQPLKGVIVLKPGARKKVDVDTAGICGLTMSGTWSSTDGGTSVVHLRSDPQAPPSFEKVMPCLGIKQDLVVGRFTLDVTLHGWPGHWTGGEARLQSAHGNIRRLTLLSRIFSVINLTDLFSDNGPSPVAGGLPYSTMDLEAKVAHDHLDFKKAVVRGEGLNLFASGKLDLSSFQTDLTVLIEPFKTIDALVSSVPLIGPLIGRVIGGKNATLVTVPVGVTGPVSDPSVMVLSPEAVGQSILSRVKDTITLPYTLLSPIFSGGKPEPPPKTNEVPAKKDDR